MMFRYRTLCLTSCAALALSSAAAQAQGADASSPAGTVQDSAERRGELGDIVVTARKRKETLISTPTAITAITGAALDARGVVDYQTLSDFTPAMKSGKQSTNRNDRYNQVLVVRGMHPGADAPSRQAASVFVDGSPIGNGSVPGLTDIERVEIVAGPQSAYYGRSTFSGAVSIVTRAPGDALRVSGDASYSSFDTRDVKASLEGGIIPGLLAARISGRYYSTDGQFENSGYPGKLGAQETKSGSLALSITPSPTTRIRLQGSIWTDDDGAPASGVLYSPDFNCRTPTATTANNYVCGKISSVPANRMTQQNQIPQNIITILKNSATVIDPSGLDNIGLLRHAKEAHGSLSQDLGGGYTFDVNASVVDNKLTFLTDTGYLDGRNRPNPSFGTAAGTAAGVLPYTSRTAIGQSYFRDASVEARISSPANKTISWLIGANGFRQRETRITTVFSNSGFATAVPKVTEGANTVGIFGAINWKIVPTVTLSVEGRYQFDTVSQYTPTANLYLEETFKSFTPRVILSYQPTSDLNIYGSYAEGVRPGEFNSSLYGLPAAFQAQVQAQLTVPIAVPEERVKMVEFGVKGNLFDRRMRILAAFYTGRWTGRHTSQRINYINVTPQPVTVVLAGSDVILRGIELETSFRATPELTFEGTFDLAQTDIRSTTDLVSLQLLGNLNPVGTTIPRYPTTSGSFSVDYQRDLGANLKGFARVDYLYTGRQYDSEANLAYTADSHRVNARIGLATGPYRIEVFGQNIFNNKVPTNITRSTDAYTGVNVLALSPPLPATVGVRVAFRY